jgi:hypothetical protein
MRHEVPLVCKLRVATEHHLALISRCWLGWSDQEVIR